MNFSRNRPVDPKVVVGLSAFFFGASNNTAAADLNMSEASFNSSAGISKSFPRPTFNNHFTLNSMGMLTADAGTPSSTGPIASLLTPISRVSRDIGLGSNQIFFSAMGLLDPPKSTDLTNYLALARTHAPREMLTDDSRTPRIEGNVKGDAVLSLAAFTPKPELNSPRVHIESPDHYISGVTVNTPCSSSVFTRLDNTICNYLATNAIPGGVVAVAKNGKILYTQSYGNCGPNNPELINPNWHQFRIASMSKAVTAICILQLVEKHKIDLSTHALKYLGLESFSKDPRCANITIEMLLQQRSGFNDKFEVGDEQQLVATKLNKKIDELTLSDMSKYKLSQYQLAAEPGSKFIYENFNYSLLGSIIEKSSGLKYAEYVQQNVCVPLGLDDELTVSKTRSSQRSKREVSYLEPHGKVWTSILPETQGESVQYENGASIFELSPAEGGLIASAPAMAKFVSSLIQPGIKECLIDQDSVDETALVRDPQLLRQMILPCAEDSANLNSTPYYYGYGLNVYRLGEGLKNAVIWHAGNMQGNSGIFRINQDGIVYVFMCNGNNSKLTAGQDLSEPLRAACVEGYSILSGRSL